MKSDKEASKNAETGSRNSYSELPETEDSSPSKTSTKKESKKSNKENREIRILRRNKTLKEKNDPDRFSGEGINFKAKIIGTEHVFDARGNRMCQGALQRLKAAIKTSGDHKQRIILNISYNGIIIKDEKTGEMLHHHPIHKISFISQDTVDKRAFGYVFGCPQSGHEFFGIKTEKIASQVVLTLRDLFLAALEIKKKEIESAKEVQKDSDSDTIQENGKEKASTNGVADSPVNGASTSNGATNYNKNTLHDELLYSNTVLLPEEDISQSNRNSNHSTEPAVDTLLDLQFTMDSLQMGISQMDHSIATAASQGFGLSFSEDDISESSNTSLPMSFHFKMDKFSALYQETLSISSRSSSTSDYNVGLPENKTEEIEFPKNNLNAPFTAFENISNPISENSDYSQNSSSSTQNLSSMSPLPNIEEKSASENAAIVAAALNEAKSKPVEDRYAVFQDIDALPSIFDNPIILSDASTKVESQVFSEEFPLNSCSEELPSNSFSDDSRESSEIKTSTPIVFADLDPLGNQPFVDKKDFFQDIKNPPKKVLKDLAGDEIASLTNGSSSHFENFNEPVGVSAELFLSSENASFEKSYVPEEKAENPFEMDTFVNIPIDPPKLPPKRLMTINAPSFVPEDFTNHVSTIEDHKWDVKNPFNPFVDDDFPDVPPPNSPPPPPPPRLPTKVCDISPAMSPPPPRPPSRTSGIPTPPLPKRKPQLGSAAQTWFSFDQEALSFPPVHSVPTVESATTDPYIPPLPSPARKFPPAKLESTTLKSASASNSPSMLRRLSTQNSLGTNCQNKESDKTNLTRSPRKMLTRHSSLMQDNLAFQNIPGLFSDSFPLTETSIVEEIGGIVLDSPPLPPKPHTIVRPRPSPSKKMLSSVHSSSPSSSNISAVESSNGTHSSSSLVFSSSEESKMGSSAEHLFVKSSESHTEVFSQSSVETVNEQSSKSQEPVQEPPKELSPDSIFRRKSDPFADDFFLSLPKKSCKNKPNGVESLQKNCTNGVDLHFESLEAST